MARRFLNSQGSEVGERGPLKRLVFFIFLSIFAVFGWTYVLIFSPLFIVNEFKIEGLVNLEVGDINREALIILDNDETLIKPLRRHIWWLDKDKLAASLKERLFAQSVAVENLNLNILRLMIEERVNRVIIHIGRASCRERVWRYV